MASDWNQLMEMLATTGLREHEQRVLAAIARKTLGYHKREDRLPISQLVEMTKLDRRHVSAALKQLEGRGLITRIGGSQGRGNAATITLHVTPEKAPQHATKKTRPLTHKTNPVKVRQDDRKSRVTTRTQGVQGVRTPAPSADNDFRRKAFETYLNAGGTLTLDRERNSLARSVNAAVQAGTPPETILAAVRDLGRKRDFPGLLKQRIADFATNGTPCQWEGIGRLRLTIHQLNECGCHRCNERAHTLEQAREEIPA